MEIIISVIIAFYLLQVAAELKLRYIRHRKHYRLGALIEEVRR